MFLRRQRLTATHRSRKLAGAATHALTRPSGHFASTSHPVR
jgi:hypothetical protein